MALPALSFCFWLPELQENDFVLFSATPRVIICYRSHRAATQTLLCRILEVWVSLKADGAWITEPFESALDPEKC